MKSTILGLIMMFTIGCSCWGANSRTAVCVVVRDVVDCTESGVQTTIRDYVPVLSWLVGLATGAGVAIDWSVMAADLSALAWGDAGCILAALQNDLSAKPALTVPMARAISSLAAFRAAQYGAVKFRVKGGAVL